MAVPQSDFQDQLVRGFTHKVNNLLSVFHGYAGLLLAEDALAPSALDSVIRIQEGADALTRLVERSRLLVRPRSVIRREVDLPEILRDLRATALLTEPPGRLLEVAGPESLPPVWTDPVRLRGALSELVRNAFEACDPVTPVRIEFRAVPVSRRAPVPPRGISISVMDHGPGIPPQAMERVFEPFFSTRSHAGALGLGLPIAAGIVRQLGGVLSMSSRPGRTVFRVRLPLGHPA